MKIATVILSAPKRPSLVYTEKTIQAEHEKELLESLAMILECDSVNLHDIETNEWLGSKNLR